MHSQFNIY